MMLIDYLESGATINTDAHCETSIRITEKHYSELNTWNVVTRNYVFNYITNPHIAQSTFQTIKKLGWEMFDYTFQGCNHE